MTDKPTTKLTVDDLVQAQQRTEATLREILESIRPTEQTPLQKTAKVFGTLLALIVWCVGAAIAYDGNLVGVCICILAATSALERLMKN